MRNKIEMYMHCMLCLRERPAGVTPSDWARLNVGSTEKGLQVWCTRHNVNIAALDFRGQKIVEETDDEAPSKVGATPTRRPRRARPRH